MTVYIYDGYGASKTDAEILTFMFSMALQTHGLRVKTLTQDTLNKPHARWQKDGDLLVFGGGEFSKVKEKLSPYGRDAIKDFAASKKYLGICKGGYAGAAQIRFLGQDGEKESDGFGFFNGVARGSLPITPALYTGKSDSAQIKIFRHEKHSIEFPALYWGGPCFEMGKIPQENLETLITLNDRATDKKFSMGIKVPVGKEGQAILLGYHAEALPKQIRQWVLQFCENEGDIQRIEREMSAYQPWKFYLGFAALLDDLAIVPRHSFLKQILSPPESSPSFLLSPK